MFFIKKVNFIEFRALAVDTDFFYMPVKDGMYYGITHGVLVPVFVWVGGHHPVLCPEHNFFISYPIDLNLAFVFIAIIQSTVRKNCNSASACL